MFLDTENEKEKINMGRPMVDLISNQNMTFG